MEDASEVDKRTIVIKGISYAWQKADLETAFSDIGPIRKCFLVGDKGAAHHKVTPSLEMPGSLPLSNSKLSSVVIRWN